jgi:hypothetical protein
MAMDELAPFLGTYREFVMEFRRLTQPKAD